MNDADVGDALFEAVVWIYLFMLKHAHTHTLSHIHTWHFNLFIHTYWAEYIKTDLVLKHMAGPNVNSYVLITPSLFLGEINYSLFNCLNSLSILVYCD